MTDNIQFTEETFKDFKETYTKAKEGHLLEFTWDGRLFVTQYAKYMIQYVEAETA